MPPAELLSPLVPASVQRRWGRFAGARPRPIETGLINLTLELWGPGGERAVLQRLHPVFSPQVNLDIAAVTAHLARHGLTTPHLLPTDDGALWVEEQGVWRALSFVSGRAYGFVADPPMAREAGRLVGRFHAALADLSHQYRSSRGQVHDTPAHLARLIQSLEVHRGHRLHPRVASLAEPLLSQAETLVDLAHLPLRHAHGDLKISNLMFDEAGHGLALIDLDTLAPMHWPLEMGDALRSWCNPRREDQHPANLDLELLAAAVHGYQEAAPGLIAAEEWQALIPGLARICLELAARFLADALNECYFGWDAARYPARGEHNLARGSAMWTLYLDVQAKRGAAEGLLREG
jgi:Ser/Thr protein kinase RdoA (MazF antagonist)